MTKRTKIELRPALKAQDFTEGQIIKQSVFIKDINDVETRFGNNTIISFDDGDSIFMNNSTLNNMIDKYGEEDKNWIGKGVRLVCEVDKVFSKKMLVLYPIV